MVFRIGGAFILLISVLCAVGCERSEESNLSQLQRALEGGYDDAMKQVDSLTTTGKGMTDKASKEFEKIFVFEYRVVRFPSEHNSSQIEAGLNELGKERWECFSAITIGDALQVTCKRRPQTILKYLPYLPKFLW